MKGKQKEVKRICGGGKRDHGKTRSRHGTPGKLKEKDEEKNRNDRKE